MRTVIFLDLDDSLFQTKDKCRSKKGLIPAAYGKDGQALSYMSPEQAYLFGWMQKGAELVPATARSLGAYRRVNLIFSHGAILDYGGLILDREGNIDPEWFGLVKEKARASKALLGEALNDASGIIEREKLRSAVRLVSDAGLDFYIMAKNYDGHTEDLDILEQGLKEGFGRKARIHRNGNNLSLLPPYLEKKAAVSFFLERERGSGEELLVLGLGDSLSDLSFMGLCHFMLMPSHSQLGKAYSGLLGPGDMPGIDPE